MNSMRMRRQALNCYANIGRCRKWTYQNERGVRDAVREAITAATVYDRNIGRHKGRRVTLSGDIENIVITIVPEEETALPAGT